MPENSNDRIQIRSAHISDEFCDLLRNVLPGNFYNNIREEIYHRFNDLNDFGQRYMLLLLRTHCRAFYSRVSPSMIAADVNKALACLEDPLNASAVLIPSDIVELSRAIEKVETVATFLISRRSSLNMSSNINFSHPNSEAGTLHHTQRTLPVQHNSHLTDGASTQYDLMPVPSHHIPPDYGRVSINMNNTNLNYSTNTQSHSQRSIASSHGIFQATEISPYGDPGASSSSTAAASHGEARAARDDVTAGHSGIFQATEISPYGDPGVSSSSTAAASHGEMSNSLQSQSQRPAASHNNPPGHDAVVNVTAGHSGIFQATEISPYGDPGVSSSSTAAASHGEMSNSLQSQSQRPAASHNNPPGHDAVVNVTAGHSGIFQATEISPYGDPGVSSSSTAAASHGEMSNSLQSHSQRPAASHNNPPGHDAVINVSAGHSGIFQATEISPYGDPGVSSSSTAAASHGEMSNSLQSHSQRPAASHNNPPGHDAVINVSAGHSGIFQATEISPYGDPGVSSSSTAAASHGEMSNSLQSHSQRPAASHNNPPGHDAVINVSAGHSGIFQATEISPYGDPGVSSSSTAAASHGEMSNSLQSHSQRPAASHNNPPGHDAVINVSAGHSDIFQATEISPYGDPGVSSSSTAAASHGEMSNSLQSHSQRPAASHNNPPGHDAVINVPAGHSGILQATEISHGDPGASSSSTAAASHGQTTRDGETAGHSKLFEILVPVNFNYAHKAGNILKSTYDSLSPSIKTSGYLTVTIASVAAFSSLAGLSLSTFKPNTLPFGWNPQLMLQIMHILTVFFFGYAFIGTMCHEFLHDDPIIFWMVEGLAYAVLTAVLVFIIWRR